MVDERVRVMLKSAGFDITDDHIKAADRQIERLMAAITPEARREAAKLAESLPWRRR
jgi:hypothetical protein